MNKFERQSRDPADHQSLTKEIEAELPEIPTNVVAVSDAPPVPPPQPGLTSRALSTAVRDNFSLGGRVAGEVTVT